MIALLTLLILSSGAFAGDKDFPQEITLVAPGSTLIQGTYKQVTSGKTWLFPESYYLTALQKAQKLEICEPALIKLRGDYAHLLSRSEKDFGACADSLQESNAREQELISKLSGAQSHNSELQNKLSHTRRALVWSWLATGALLVGAGGALYITNM